MCCVGERDILLHEQLVTICPKKSQFLKVFINKSNQNWRQSLTVITIYVVYNSNSTFHFPCFLEQSLFLSFPWKLYKLNHCSPGPTWLNWQLPSSSRRFKTFKYKSDITPSQSTGPPTLWKLDIYENWEKPSQVGGSLGLWLGLGVLQVLQEVTKMALPITTRCTVCGNSN